MEIKHFVFGKFLDLSHDFDIRIISPDLDETTARTMAQRINKLIPLCTLPVQGQPNIEYIGLLYAGQSTFAYVRFMPAANNYDEHGRTMIGFYHALLFDEQELGMLEMKPWKCRELFINGFDHEKITGWDQQVWLRREDLAHLRTSPKRMHIYLDQLLYGAHAPVGSGVYVATDEYIQYIATVNPYSTLEDRDSQTLLHIFNAGIILHYPVDSGQIESMGGMVKFVSGQHNLPEEFKKNNWRNLSVASIRSYVSSFKPIQEPALKMFPPQIIRDEKDIPDVIDYRKGLEAGGGWLSLEGSEARLHSAVTSGPAVQTPPARNWQKQLLITAFLICLSGMAILTWKLYHKEQASASVAQKAGKPESPAVVVVKPVMIEPVPPPASGERVSKAEYDNLRNKFIKLTDQLKQKDGECVRLFANNNQLNEKLTAMNTENTSLKAEVRKATEDIAAIEVEKTGLDGEVSALKAQQERNRRELSSIREHITDSLNTRFRTTKQSLTDSIRSLQDQLKPKAPKNQQKPDNSPA